MSNKPQRDYRKEALDCLVSAKAWYDCMFDQATEDEKTTHYGLFLVNTYWSQIRERINNMIDGIRDLMESDIDVVIRTVETVMEMLNNDLMNGEEIAKPYYNFLTDIRLNLKQAQWNLVFERKKGNAK